jgi:flavodoxin
MSKILITYFGCYGTTKKFAEEIADITKGDLFELVPVVAYDKDTNHYEQLAELAKKERDQDTRPEIKELPDVSKYDTIFIGYPVWWYTYPQIIRTFIESVDLSGKTIIPFNTHEGSGDGGTYKELQKDIPNAKVLIGLPIRGANMEYDQRGNIKEWLDSIKF